MEKYVISTNDTNYEFEGEVLARREKTRLNPNEVTLYKTASGKYVEYQSFGKAVTVYDSEEALLDNASKTLLREAGYDIPDLADKGPQKKVVQL
ncbi:hypothetical protein N9R79_07575 [Vibrio sp.]|nr:hypothetical protein [Vibrio sp.]